MGSPTDLREQAQSVLEQGEQLQRAFRGLKGPHPYIWLTPATAGLAFALTWAFLGEWIVGFGYSFLFLIPCIGFYRVQRRMVLLTNRSVVVVKASASYKPVRVLRRLPRQRLFGSVDARSRWSKIRLRSGNFQEDLWIPQSDYPELKAADDGRNSASSSAEGFAVGTREVGWIIVSYTTFGLLLLIVGIADAFTALDEQYRMLAIVFTLAGAIMIGAGIFLAWPTWNETLGRDLVVMGSISSFVVGIYLIVTQLLYVGPRPPIMALGFIVAAGSVIAGAHLFRANPDGSSLESNAVNRSPSQGERSRGHKTILAGLASLGITAGLIWTIIQFWYTSQYLPGRTGATITVSSELKKANQSYSQYGLTAMTGTVKIKNSTSIKAQIIASLYTVSGTRLIRISQDDASFFRRAVRPPNPEPGDKTTEAFSISRYSRESPREVLQMGKILPDGWWLAPQEEYSTQFVVYVPTDVNHAYDNLQLGIQIITAKGARLNLDYPPTYYPYPVVSPEDDYATSERYVATEMPIKPLSLIHHITKGRHAIRVIRTFQWGSDVPIDFPEAPFLYACIDRAARLGQILVQRESSICSDSSYQEKLGDYYGLLRTSETYEIPVPK
jgi:hypothetical protein